MTHSQKASGARSVRRFDGFPLSFFLALISVWIPVRSAAGADGLPRGEESPQVAQWMVEQLSAHQTPGGVLHMAVQLTGPVDAQTNVRLREAGIRLLAPLAPGTYLAAVDIAGSAAQVMQAGAVVKIEGVSAIAPVAPGSKLSPDLRNNKPYSWATREINGKALVEFNLKYASSTDAAAAAALVTNSGGTILNLAPRFNRIRGQAPQAKMLSLAMPHWVVAVHSVDPPAAATDANNSNQISGQMMGVDVVQAAPYSLTGRGVNVMELDEGQIDLHPELQGRVTEVDTAYPASSHSTHVAGTLAATGLDPSLKGMAPGAQLYSYSFQVDDSAYSYLDAIYSHAAQLSTNSWGSYLTEYIDSSECNWIGSYGTSESDIDQVVNENDFAIVFAMGNDRNKSLCSLQQQGGFYSTGTPAAAKNTIAVAALDGTKAVTYFSNYGPTADGRLKPDISALGSNVLSLDLGGGTAIMSGTSMATPAITGTLALLIQSYNNLTLNFGSPSPAFLKAVLLNTAVDLGNPGPDYTYGYGIPDAAEAVKTIEQSRFGLGSVDAGGTQAFTFNVPAGAPALRVLMAYSDVEGLPGSTSPLVNDLDLTVVGPDGQTRLPLTLDPSNPAADAVPAKNGRDPVEQVVVQNPAAGVWTFTVTGASVPIGPQGFAITWSYAPVAAQPPCSRSISVDPSGLSVDATGGAQTLAITQSRSCAALQPVYPDSWIQASTDPIAGTAAIKLNIDPNTSGARRVSTLQFSDGVTNPLSVQVAQAAPCYVGQVTPGTPLNDSLSLNDCEDAWGDYKRSYTFTGKAGQALAASLDSPDFYQVLVLELPDGTQILESDIVYDPAVRIPQGNRGFILPFDGQYTLLVTSYFAEEPGAFTLDVEFPDPAKLDSVVKWNFVPMCPALESGTLGSASAHDGHRGALFPVDSYIVYGQLGDKITATVTGASFDPVLYAMPLPTENIVATSDNAQPNKPASISYTILTTGFYTVQVTPYLFGQSGAYTLALSGCRMPTFVPPVSVPRRRYLPQ